MKYTSLVKGPYGYGSWKTNARLPSKTAAWPGVDVNRPATEVYSVGSEDEEKLLSWDAKTLARALRPSDNNAPLWVPLGTRPSRCADVGRSSGGFPGVVPFSGKTS